MKAELIDVSDIKKSLVFEIPSTEVDTVIDGLTRSYGRAARVPGFRPGKVPTGVVRRRFRDQILQDAAENLIPRAVDEALRERGLEPVATPDIRDVTLEAGQPLRFTADFETRPEVDPGDLSTLSVKRPEIVIEAEAVDRALAALRERAARYEPIEGRTAELGDLLTVDLVRRPVPPASETSPDEAAPATAGPDADDRHEGVRIELGASANPPGFDEKLVGAAVGERRAFVVTFPADHEVEELAGQQLQYEVAVTALGRRLLPDLDDEFAKEIGEFETLDALRARVAADLEQEAERERDRDMRREVLTQLAGRIAGDVPDALVEQELESRLRALVHRFVEQRIDPRSLDLDWNALRERQREPAIEAVKGALALDAIADREGLTITPEDLDAELERLGARTGRSAAAMKGQLERDGALNALAVGMRRERALDQALARATVAPA